jgi:peptidyl-prolyl cis-trans isomerase C
MTQRKARHLTAALLAALLIPTVSYAESPSDVLVTYGTGKTITINDFEAALRTAPANVRDEARTNPKLATQVLETIMLTRVIADEARSLGLDKNPVARGEMEQVADRALAAWRLEALEKAMEIPDYTQVAREQYEINKDRYVEPERIDAAHVLIATKDRDEASALARAQEVRAKAIAGQPFPELAKEYSDDPGSKKKGGDLGYFARGRMVKPFEEAAFALKQPGDISEVVKTPFGFHVIKLLDRQPGRQKTFEEVKDGIIAPMRNKLVNAEKARYTSKIRNDPSIKIEEATLHKFLGIKGDAAPAEAAPAPQ